MHASGCDLFAHLIVFLNFIFPKSVEINVINLHQILTDIHNYTKLLDYSVMPIGNVYERRSVLIMDFNKKIKFEVGLTQWVIVYIGKCFCMIDSVFHTLTLQACLFVVVEVEQPNMVSLLKLYFGQALMTG